MQGCDLTSEVLGRFGVGPLNVHHCVFVVSSCMSDAEWATPVVYEFLNLIFLGIAFNVDNDCNKVSWFVCDSGATGVDLILVSHAAIFNDALEDVLCFVHEW